MLAKKLVWSAWGLLPVAALAYHFGPGQRAYIEDRARDVLAAAERLEAAAESAQEIAYQKHLASLKARKASLRAKTPELTEAARIAAEEEDSAYTQAASAWRSTADKLREAQDMLASCDSNKTSTVRIARDRAVIRSGSIAEGVGDLEMMLEDLGEGGQEESTLARQAREEAATGYYYGARLMRASGKPASDWREVSGWASQNLRYLAETSAGVDGTKGSKAAELQKNLELVLNLEQSSAEDLQAKPLPKFSPRGNGNGLREGKRPGKTKRPPRKKDDARGAGGVGDIEGGW